MTRIKICGLTNLDDVTVAVEAGADMLGFIFFEKSPRTAQYETVAKITEALRSMEAERIPLCVGVFVNPTVDEVLRTMERCRLQAVQIHRPFERPELFQTLPDQTGAATYFAFQLNHSKNQQGQEPMPSLIMPHTLPETAPWLPQVLVDAYHPELVGGTGIRIDVDIARSVAERYERLMLAGGLTPDNVAESIRVARPWAVDVASGVEATPGKKDHGKLRAFIQAVKEIDKELENDLAIGSHRSNSSHAAE